MAKSVGVEFNKFECLWEYCAGLISPGTKYAALSMADQLKARENAEEACAVLTAGLDPSSERRQTRDAHVQAAKAKNLSVNNIDV